MRMLIGVFSFATLTTLLLAGCGTSDPATNTIGSGGSGGSGGKKEPADYAKAFPQNSVPRLDITVAPEDWKAMVDDMTSINAVDARRLEVAAAPQFRQIRGRLPGNEESAFLWIRLVEPFQQRQ
jgi:hypothetical protein